MIISVNAEKALKKFMKKKLNQLGKERNFFNTIKGKCKTPTANIILSSKRLFPLKSGATQ